MAEETHLDKLNRLRADIDRELSSLGIQKEDCRVCEWGVSGGNGLVVDHGPDAKIVRLQTDGGKLLFVQYAQDVQYTILEVTTNDPMTVGRHLLKTLPCSATVVENTKSLRFRARRWWYGVEEFFIWTALAMAITLHLAASIPSVIAEEMKKRKKLRDAGPPPPPSA